MNGIQRFTWDVSGEDEVGCSKPPLQFDWYRPPIPMMNTEARSFLHGLYGMPPVKAISDAEVVFINNSSLAYVHFDRDAAANNSKAIALKKRQASHGPRERLHQRHGLLEPPALLVGDERRRRH